MSHLFHWDWQEHLLFDGWNPKSFEHYAIALFATFFVSILHQYLLALLSTRSIPKQEQYFNLGLKSVWNQELFYLRSAFLRMVASVLGYALMLLVMTMNLGLLLAVLFGVFFGSFSFDRHRGHSVDKKVILDEHC